MQFWTREELLNHTKLEHKVTVQNSDGTSSEKFKCPKCFAKYFSDKSGLMKHLKSIHFGKIGANFVHYCSLCMNEEFPTFFALQDHMLTVHKINDDENGVTDTMFTLVSSAFNRSIENYTTALKNSDGSLIESFDELRGHTAFLRDMKRVIEARVRKEFSNKFRIFV